MSNVIETPVPLNEMATGLVEQVRKARETIPGFLFVTKVQRRRLSHAATVSDQFLLTVAVAIDEIPEIALAAKCTAAEIREVINYSNAFQPVAVEYDLAARGIRETIASRRAEVGVRALRVYKMAQTLNQPSDREQLAPHLSQMRRALGRGRPRSTPQPEQPPAQPSVG